MEYLKATGGMFSKEMGVIFENDILRKHREGDASSFSEMIVHSDKIE